MAVSGVGRREYKHAYMLYASMLVFMRRSACVLLRIDTVGDTTISEGAMRIIWLLIAIVLGLMALVGLPALPGAFSASIPGGFVLCGVLTLFGAGAWAAFRKFKPSSHVAQTPLAAEAAAYFEQLSASMRFEPVTSRRLMETPDAPLLAVTEAQVLELEAVRVGAAAGTRINIGGVPLYLGRTHSRTQRVAKPSAVGELGLTPKSLLYFSTDTTLSVPFAKIAAVEVHLDGFTVGVTDRQRPYTILVRNGLLYGLLLKNLVRLQLKGRDLPPGAEIRVS